MQTDSFEKPLLPQGIDYTYFLLVGLILFYSFIKNTKNIKKDTYGSSKIIVYNKLVSIIAFIYLLYYLTYGNQYFGIQPQKILTLDYSNGKYIVYTAILLILIGFFTDSPFISLLGSILLTIILCMIDIKTDQDKAAVAMAGLLILINLIFLMSSFF